MTEDQISESQHEMPSIVVDNLGNSLFYVDSGAPTGASSDKPYTTLIAVHGTAFHGGECTRHFNSHLI